jgi:hypothetical protein
MKKLIGYAALIAGLLLGAALVAFPAAITQLAGLAVAQSSTQWNSVKDMAQGDSQSSGVMLVSPCLWNGTTCDRQRGTIAGGGTVTIASTSATPVAVDSGQGATLLNATQVSAANTTQSITLAATAGMRNKVTAIDAYLSAAGVCNIIIFDGAGNVFLHAVNTFTAAAPYNPQLGASGVSAPTGNIEIVSIGACGAGIVSTLNVVASRQ